MLSENPYQSPVIPAELLEPPWPETGVYRDRTYVVLHHAAKLPPICVKSGKPADVEQTIELVGGNPNDGSVPEDRRKLLGEKVYRISVPLSHDAIRRARWLQVCGVGAALGSLVVLVVAMWFQTSLRSLGRLEVLPLVLVLGLIVSLSLLIEARRMLQLECVARGYFWITKASPEYLMQLPPWPVPRPSWWRQALYGPAGVGMSSGNGKEIRR